MSREVVDFGFRDVAPAEKRRLVDQVFAGVAARYDLMNDLMSLGLHRLWKRHFVATLGIRPGMRVLDLAAGSGDVAALIAPRLRPGGEVVLADRSLPMLGRGRDRMLDEGFWEQAAAVAADAEALPFPDRSFDRVTIAFGLRNVADRARALAEAFRVLKIGGTLGVLEFSRLRIPALAPLYELHAFAVLPALGRLVVGDDAPYRYLAESIRRHPDQEALARMLAEAGFSGVRVRNLAGGIVAIHTGVRA
ncbi:MAG: class I SAM-dependent methyltransferase [Xanthomonadales bacterium]|nr:class I SAM-dependent methyltransferase [Xanthomonadales bacterium]